MVNSMAPKLSAMPQLLAQLELAAAEPSAQNIFPSHGSTLGAQLLQLVEDTYFMVVIHSLLLRTELLPTIKGSQGDSKVSCKETLPEMAVCCLKSEVKTTALTSQGQMSSEPASAPVSLFVLLNKRLSLRQLQLFGLQLSPFPSLSLTHTLQKPCQ